MPDRIGLLPKNEFKMHTTILRADSTLHIISELNIIRPHNTTVIQIYFIFYKT